MEPIPGELEQGQPGGAKQARDGGGEAQDSEGVRGHSDVLHSDGLLELAELKRQQLAHVVLRKNLGDKSGTWRLLMGRSEHEAGIQLTIENTLDVLKK